MMSEGKLAPDNRMRHEKRALSDVEKAQVLQVKDAGLAFLRLVDEIDTGHALREIALAKTKIEEAVMWAVKGITG